ncbi:MAG: hypothetical protein K1X88_31995 [Nannocystaceae bacterium]|nr:hypothetical protein [Nannocystaceae bacterium]
MPRLAPYSAIVLVAALAGCEAARGALDRLRGDGEGDEVAPAAVVEPSAPASPEPAAPSDAEALAAAVASMAAEPAADERDPVAVAPKPAVAAADTLAELEVHDVTVEFTAASGPGYYYGYGYGGEPPKVLVIEAKARTKASSTKKAEVLVRARCNDGGVELADIEAASTDGRYGDPVPAPGVDFKVGARLFQSNTLGDPSDCRVTISLRDNGRSPARRGALELCWTPARKTAAPCQTPAPAATEADWSVREAQFLPSNEFGFAVVAGTGRAPDRVGVRVTCHQSGKHFVEVQLLSGRWYGLEPGDVFMHRQTLQSAWEFMRSNECDIEIQDVSYDFETYAVRGVRDIGRRCMRPSGLRDGQCRTAVDAVPVPEGTTTPVSLAVLNASASSYMNWYNAYAQAELTVLAPLTKAASVEFVSTCGKKVERVGVSLSTSLDQIYPGQSLRVQGGVSGTGRRKPSSCRTEFVLHDNDAAGVKQSWRLAEQCYTRDGMQTPCPGAPAGSAPPGGVVGGLGVRGTGFGSIGLGSRAH